jgi:hypothetical protein
MVVSGYGRKVADGEEIACSVSEPAAPELLIAQPWAESDPLSIAPPKATSLGYAVRRLHSTGDGLKIRPPQLMIVTSGIGQTII